MRSAPLFAAVAIVAALATERPAAARCRVLELRMTPAMRGDNPLALFGVDGFVLEPGFNAPQIVVWLEDAQGRFVDTLFITRATGTYGLGNRPGISDFNSELLWPYGRRDSLFPVWAHRRGHTYPKVMFQTDRREEDLSQPFAMSSVDPYYCRPLNRFLQGDMRTWQHTLDAGTCASPGNQAHTDKGKFSADETSLYPPRNDIVPGKEDSADAAHFAELNDLDAVSRATPPPGQPFVLRWALPDDLADGDYTIWVEVAAEFDHNATYHDPAPALASYANEGFPYRGQPSVLWQVPFVVGANDSAAVARDYTGYGDPDGLDGTVRVPDATITTDLEGSGANRLLLESSPEGAYRVWAAMHPNDDSTPPGLPQELAPADVRADGAALTFRAPGDDDQTGTAVAYEIRYRVGAPLDAASFTTDGIPADAELTPVAAGGEQMFSIQPTSPETHYWVGVRAVDECLNAGPPAIVHFVTPRAALGDVDACFVATAAWGSPLAADVGILRRFRDQALRSSVLGELFVETYYTFGPALAAVIAPSDAARGLARAALSPMVELARFVVE